MRCAKSKQSSIVITMYMYTCIYRKAIFVVTQAVHKEEKYIAL